MERYIHKFKPGKHYVMAYEELSSKKYGVTGIDEQDRIVGSTLIAKSQVQWFFDNNFKLNRTNSNGRRNFIVPEKIFLNSLDSFKILEDLWIGEQIDKTFNMNGLFTI